MIRIQREVLGVRNILQPHRVIEDGCNNIWLGFIFNSIFVFQTLIMEGTLLRVETSTVQLTHFFLVSFLKFISYSRQQAGCS